MSDPNTVQSQSERPVKCPAESAVEGIVALLPTAYVVRREGYVLTRVCLSVHRGIPRSGPDRGVPRSGPDGGGRGTPGQVQTGGTQSGPDGGTPTRSSQGVSQPGPDRGYPT